MLKRRIEDEVWRAVSELLAQAQGREKETPDVEAGGRPPFSFTVERPREEGHGDFATNAAFALAPVLRQAPARIAADLASRLEAVPLFDRVEPAGPGFVNFHVSKSAWEDEVRAIIASGRAYAAGALPEEMTRGQRIQVEFVSANPVGPMHVGHGRWAAIGDTLARVLEKAGYAVEREFYINDAGTQMDIFATSVACRYSELLGEEVAFPEDGYRGEYIKDIAREIIEAEGDRYLSLPFEERKAAFKEIAYRMVLAHLKKVLERMDVRFDVWFSERTLHEGKKVQAAIETLRERGYVYEKDGALWLRTTDFGDEKDRVLIRASGEPTYFAADIAYHIDKHERGFTRVIDIWGADHHGYVKRMQAAMQALGYGPDFLEIIIGQLVNLYAGGQPVRMSKRTGEMVTLEELLDEVGKDALRFFFCSKSTDSSLDFDIELAKRQSQENPVYYVQYAHARICSVLRFARESGLDPDALAVDDFAGLTHDAEFRLVRALTRYPELVESCALSRGVHHIPNYLIDLAREFHAFYTQCRIVQAEEPVRSSRLLLARATRDVIADGLWLLGVEAPETM